MAQYKTGTVSVTSGSATVTGTGTLWTANATPGDGFTVAGTGVPYTVASVTNDTSLTLSAPYQGATASGQSYAIYRDFTTNESLPELSQGDIETATVWTRAVRKIDALVGAATTTSRGTVEKATTAEAEAGTVDKYPDAAGTHSAIRELAVGTVSQSAGVPTGAIIERGSNANGEYVKFADGTLICHIRAVASFDLANLLSTGVLTTPASFNNGEFTAQVTSNNQPVMPVTGRASLPYSTPDAQSSTVYRVGFISDGSFVSGDACGCEITLNGRWF